MGVSKYIYTVYDAKTGEFVAKGTAAQLAGKGFFKDAGSVSTCYMSNRKTDKPRRWRMEREALSDADLPSTREAGLPSQLSVCQGWRVVERPKRSEPCFKEGAPQRRVYIYTVWDMAGKLLGEGTAQELAAKGICGCKSTVGNIYRQGGKSERFGVGKMTRREEMRPLQLKPYKHQKPNPKPERRRVELDEPCKIPNPTPLQLDVHDLCRYNRKARKLGKPELSYGVWAAKGKPGEP